MSDVGNGGSNGHALGDSAAKRRQEELKKELGIDTYARYPRELLEFRMDRPPKEPDPRDVVAWQKWDEERRKWKPVHGPKTRVYATYMRYSWCWPICLKYAVVTDERDEILRDHKGRPLVLSEEAVSDMLGLSKQRVSAVVLDLMTDKLIRTQVAPGRQHSLAVFLEAKPMLTAEERRVKSTLVATGVPGPRLEPAVLRRFSSLLNQLGADEDLIFVPCNGNSAGGVEQVRVGDYRTLVWKQIVDNRTLFLQTLKAARYSERKAYADTATQVRNLIDQRESSEGGRAAAAGSSAPPVAPPPPQASPVKRGGFGGYGSSGPQAATRGTGTAAATGPAEESITPVLEAFEAFGGIDDEAAWQVVSECRKQAHVVTIAEVAAAVSEIHIGANARSAIGILRAELPKFFRSVKLSAWREKRAAAVLPDWEERKQRLILSWRQGDGQHRTELEQAWPEIDFHTGR